MRFEKYNSFCGYKVPSGDIFFENYFFYLPYQRTKSIKTMKLRIATFNLENLDDKPNRNPSLAARINVLRPQLKRLRADILCFQEVNGQEQEGQPRDILALRELLQETPYESYFITCTKISNGRDVYDERNLVIASKFDFIDPPQQLRNDLIDPIKFNYVTDNSPDDKNVNWERPIQYVKISTPDGHLLHIINLHLKSRMATSVSGQKLNRSSWRTSAGWAEGFFISSMKRVGQALETRILLDKIFEEDPLAKIVVCGDFNAPPGEVPVEAICGKVQHTANPDLIPFEMIPCENTIPESSRYTYLHFGNKRLLDHLLISKSLIPFYSHSEIHNEQLKDESIAFAFESNFPESDHAPFVADFEF